MNRAMLYLTLRQYEYVAAVARAGSLSAAAKVLNVSQPSITVALTQVEARLGQRLFVRRKGAPVTMTAFGEEFVPRVEAVLALAAQLDNPQAVARGPGGRLTLGLFEDLAPLHLGRLLAALRQGLPDADIHHRTGDFTTLARDLLEGRVDLAVTFDLGLDASFHKVAVFSQRPHAFLACGHPLAGRGTVTLTDLAAQPLILFDEGLSVRHMLTLFRRAGFTPVVRHRVRSVEVMRSLAAHGEGVGISYSVPTSNQSQDGCALVSLPITDAAAAEPVILARADAGDLSDLQARAWNTVSATLRDAGSSVCDPLSVAP